MYLSSKPSPLEQAGAYPETQRAGLRIAPVAGEPTGVFVVIEMSILVIVTALAMVSIIVSNSEDGRVDRESASGAHVQQHADRDGSVGTDRRPAADSSTR